MADNYLEGCRSQLLIDAATVRNVRGIRFNQSVSLREFGTSTTACATVNVKGRTTTTVDFDVVLANEEMIYDVVTVGSTYTLVIEYYDNAGVKKSQWSIPVIIESISDDHPIDEGGEITASVAAKSNGAATYT